MGFNRPQWKFLNTSLQQTNFLSKNIKLPKAGRILLEENYYGKNMLELGCQQIRELVRNSLNSKATAKSYFRSIGINITSIDIKGCYGSKKVDLRKPIDGSFYNKFDIITNSGTTEHIVPLEGQYQAFKNIHLCSKVGGVMIHILPGIGKYYGHCQTYYDYKFFEELSILNNYKLVLMEPIKKREKFLWIGICLIKQFDNMFTEDKKGFFKHIEFIDKKICKRHRKNHSKYM